MILLKSVDGLDIPKDAIIEVFDDSDTRSHNEIWKVIAFKLIDEYMLKEFGEVRSEYRDNPDYIPLAHTYWEDEEMKQTYTIAVVANLDRCELYTFANNYIVGTNEYKDIEDMCKHELKYLAFDDLVYVSDDMLEKMRLNVFGINYKDIKCPTYGYHHTNMKRKLREEKFSIVNDGESVKDDPLNDGIIEINYVPRKLADKLPLGKYVVENKLVLHKLGK